MAKYGGADVKPHAFLITALDIHDRAASPGGHMRGEPQSGCFYRESNLGRQLVVNKCTDSANDLGEVMAKSWLSHS
jgi:hypothetical protein